MMTIEQLKYVMELANHHSLQKTADLLHLSKPGLSQAISQLERELGLKIFNRTSRGSYLTNAGKEMMPVIRHLLDDNLQLEQLVENLRPDQQMVTVKVGYVNTMFKPFIDQAQQMEQQGKVRLEFHQELPREIVKHLRNNQLELGFLDIYSDDRGMISGLQFVPIHDSHLQLFTMPNSPLAAKKNITIDELRQQKFIVFDDPYNIREFNHLQSICGPLQIILKTGDVLTAYEAMKKLGALTLSIGWQIGQSIFSEGRNVVPISLAGYLDDQFTFGWATNPQYPLSQEAQSFIKGANQRFFDNADGE